MARSMDLNSAPGLPRQKLDKVQEAFLTKLEPGGVLSRISAMGVTAPASITMSRVLAVSPARLPRAQMAYSTTSTCWEPSKITRTLTAPLSIKTYTCVWSPDATLVRHHEASNCSLGLCSFLTNSMNLGTKLASMTACRGGLSSNESSLRKPMVAKVYRVSSSYLTSSSNLLKSASYKIG